MRAPLVIGIDLKPFERGLQDIAKQFSLVLAEIKITNNLLREIRDLTIGGDFFEAPHHHPGER